MKHELTLAQKKINSIAGNGRVLPMVALLQLKLINKTKIYIMKNSNDETFNATIGNTVLPAVPFMAKWKGHYGAVKVKSVNGDKAIVEIRFANPYLNYEKEANTKDLELYPEHNCIPDSFNGHCPVCGRYCR